MWFTIIGTECLPDELYSMEITTMLVMTMATFSCSGIPIFSQAAVGYDGPQEGEKVAEHGKSVVDGSGAIFTEQELVSKKEN